MVSAEHPFELTEGRIAFDENQNLAKIQLPITQSRQNDGYFTDIELFEPKGEKAVLGQNSIAGIVVKMDLTFFELAGKNHEFKQSDNEGQVEVRRLNNLAQPMSLSYTTSSPLAISDWNGSSPSSIDFEANAATAQITMTFDPTPISTSTEKVTLKILPDLSDRQRSTDNHTAVVLINYDIEPTKINFTEPIFVASKRLGKLELPITCVAKNRTSKSKVCVSWHSEGLRREQKGTVTFIGKHTIRYIHIFIINIKVNLIVI